MSVIVVTTFTAFIIITIMIYRLRVIYFEYPILPFQGRSESTFSYFTVFRATNAKWRSHLLDTGGREMGTHPMYTYVSFYLLDTSLL